MQAENKPKKLLQLTSLSAPTCIRTAKFVRWLQVHVISVLVLLTTEHPLLDQEPLKFDLKYSFGVWLLKGKGQSKGSSLSTLTALKSVARYFLYRIVQLLSTITINQLILIILDAVKSFQVRIEKFCHTYLAVKSQKTQCASNPLKKTFKVSGKIDKTNTNQRKVNNWSAS